MQIPSGLKNDRYHDVSEVELGRSCGCICPSCKQSLVAKKGDPEKMVHHFAHDKKAKDELTEKIECQFSFCVAARLVLKRCFREFDSFQIDLPDWKLNLSVKDNYERDIQVSGYVTQGGSLTVEHFVVEPESPYNELDVLCHVGDYKVGIHFSYSGRPAVVSDELAHISVVDINLDLLEVLYQEYQTRDGYSFKELVLEYALSIGERQWLSHARYSKRKTGLNAKLCDLPKQSNENLPVEPPHKPLRVKPFRKRRSQSEKRNGIVKVKSHNGMCVRCQEGKVGYIDDLICTRCLQTYFAEGIFHTGDIKRAVIERYVKHHD